MKLYNYGKKTVIIECNYKLSLIDYTIYDTYDTIICCLIYWFHEKLMFSEFKKAKVIILANTMEEYNMYKKNYKYDCVFFNHNALINSEKYTIIQDTDKCYDLVVNSRFISLKRTHLAKQVPSVVFIGSYGNKSHGEPIFNTFGTYVNFKDNIIDKNTYNRLNQDQISKYYNESYVGGIFSSIEGACFSSSEYLLCGIPVVSTQSKGGRDIWYTKDNSIICEPNEVSVAEAVELAKKKIKDGTFNKFLIRSNHIQLMNEHKNRLALHLHTIFLEGDTGIDVPIEQIMKDLVLYQ
jgi:glycosyltransferase involved in cell wall biosynthesis